MPNNMSMTEEGRPDSKVLFLAQAPSYVEKKVGRPLVGPSGEVFDSCLHQAGLIRREVYILNMWPEEVTRKTLGTSQEAYYTKGGDLLWHPTKGLTDLGIEMSSACRDKIAASGANLIVSMGAQATELLVGKRPMMKWRGSIMQGGEAASGKKVIPTLHPASTIHGIYINRYLIIADMEKAAREKEYKELRLPERDIILEPSLREVVHFMEECRAAGRVATDIEVINHQVSCFSMCHRSDEIMVVPFHTEDGRHYWSEDEEAEVWLAYARMMGDPAIAKINQNLVGFDSVFLFQQNGIRTRGPLYDTMIAQSIMYPEFRMGLDFITSIHTREPYYKDEGKMWKGLGGSIETFWKYCGKDAAVAMEAWDKLSQELTEQDYWPTYNMTVDLAASLTYMSARGFKVDRVRLAETHKRVVEEARAKEAELARVADWGFNPLSPKQCQQYFYVTKGLTPYKGKTGGITTDDIAMSRIFRRYGLPEAKLVQEIRALRKLQGTYLEINFDKDDRLRCSWNVRGTWTGRLSSSQTVFDTGANMQNLDPRFREFLVADEG